MLTFLKSSVQRFLAIFGVALVRTNKPTHASEIYRGTMAGAIRALSQRHPHLQAIIDIGASDGRWSLDCMEYFPDLKYLLVEAQEFHRPALNEFTHSHANAQFVLAAAGDRVGKIYFDAGDPFGGQASHLPHAQNNIEVPVTTLDHEVQQRGLTGPFLIKFDTHGFEVPILEGAAQTLLQTEVIVMECYAQRLMPSSLPFHEMCQYLDQKGFRCIDLVDPVWRSNDDTFWQMDLVFVRKDRIEFTNTSYD